MRVAAILAPGGNPGLLNRFRTCGVELCLRRELKAGDSFGAVLVFGGDGAIHRQLPELRELGVPLLPVATGSGNDFARELGMSTPRQAQRAWEQYLRGENNVRQVDLGLIRELRNGYGASHFFCCVASVGLDAQANRRANRMPGWLRGHGGYLLAALREVFTFQFPQLHLSVDSEPPDADDGENGGAAPIASEQRFTEFDGPVTLLTFANSRYYGGGLKIAPYARLNDGLLDLCLVRKTSRRRILRYFPNVLSGEHIKLPEVEYEQVRSFRLETERPLDVYADGEYICQTPIEASVIPQSLRVIAADRS